MTILEHATGTVEGLPNHAFGSHARGEASVFVTNEQHVAYIRMDDGRGNALGEAMLLDLDAAFDSAAAADAILLTGRQRIFSGGLDLFEVAPYSRAEILDLLDLLHRVRRKVYAFPRPLVVAVSGSAIGAGASIACCGDTRMAVQDRGVFALPEVQLGVPVPSSALEIVRSTLSAANADKVLLFGGSFGPAEALAMGMFHQLLEADQLEGSARAATAAAAKLPSSAVSIKNALRRETLRRMDAARAESHEAFAAAWVSTEARTRIASVLGVLSRSKET